MATTAKKVIYFALQIPNRVGEASRILTSLAKSGVNLHAFTGFPNGRRSQADFIPVIPSSFLSAARRMKLRVSKRKSGFVIRGNDQRGALANVLSKLSKAKINVTAVDAVGAGSGRFGAILWVKAKDVNKAAKALHAK